MKVIAQDINKGTKLERFEILGDPGVYGSSLSNWGPGTCKEICCGSKFVKFEKLWLTKLFLGNFYTDIDW